MSSPPLRVFLTPEQDKTLFELRKESNIPQRTKDRASVLRLSSQGWKIKKIAIYLGWSVKMVRSAINRWKSKGLIGLWDSPRPGRNKKWTTEDIAYLEKSLEQEQRTYNSKQLVKKLHQDRGISLSYRHLRRILKKKAFFGNELVNLTKRSKIKT